MATGDMVDAALAGLDLGELVTIPPLQDNAVWDRFEADRKVLMGSFGHNRPAHRYGIPAGPPAPEIV